MDVIANRYDVQSEIGRGGMGIVYRVYDRLTDDYLALKRMGMAVSKPTPQTEAVARDTIFSLAMEFRSVASLYHPNIVSVLDYGIDDLRHPYMTMELVDEPLLITEYAKGLPFGDKVRLIMELLQGIEYLHRCKVVHRDIKPENILIDGHGRVKLTDFGLAVNHTLSLSGQDSGISGTIAYLAPEIFQQLGDHSIQSDLFAVAVVAYEILAETYPFNKTNAAILLYSLMQDSPDTSMLSDDLSDVLLQALAKKPDMRFASAREMIVAFSQASGIEIPVESSNAREGFLSASQFIGRDDELQQLKEALDNILVGVPDVIQGKLATVDQATGSTWLIGGEAGIGKSRLIDEIRIRSTMRGALVLQGQGMADSNLFFGMWRNPIRKLVLSVELTPLQTGILKQIVPDIGELLDIDVPDVPSLDATAQRDRLIDAIASLFVQTQQPVVLIMEDLQWAIESLAPLKALASIAGEHPFLIIGSFRTEEAPDLAAELGDMIFIQLERFSQEETESLSVSILGDSVRESALVDYLQAEAEGNAYFMVEIIRELAETAGSLNRIGFATLPNHIFAGGIQEVISRRLNRVPAWAHKLLELVALSGRFLDLDLVNVLISVEAPILHGEPASLPDWLRVCEEASVLRVSEGEWQFEHDKLRETVVQNIPDESFVPYYRQLAEAVETTYPGDNTRAIVLLEYWHQAKDLEKELAYLEITAETLIYTLAETEQARHYLMRGLEKLPEQDARRVKLLLYLSETYWRVDYVQGEKLAQQALAIALQHDDVAGIAKSYLALGLMVRDRGRYDEAETYHLQSLELFRELDDESGIADNLRILGIIAHDRSQLDVAGDYYQQALNLHEKLGEQVKVGMIQTYLGVLAYARGNYDAAVDLIGKGLAISQATGNKSYEALALNNLAMTFIKQEDFNLARDYFEQSLALNRDINNHWGIANTHINLGFMSLEMNDDAVAYTELVRGITKAREIEAINLVLEALVGIADWYIKQNRQLDALQLVSLVMAHPQHNDDVRSRYQSTLDILRQSITEQEIIQVQEKALSVDVNQELERMFDTLTR